MLGDLCVPEAMHLGHVSLQFCWGWIKGVSRGEAADS